MNLLKGTCGALVWAGFVLTAPRAALAEGMRVVDLPEAVHFAREHQPQLRASQARIALREAETELASSQWLPTIGTSAQLFAATANNTTGSYVTTGKFDIPRVGSTRAVSDGTWDPYPSTLVAIGARQELFDFGRIAAQVAAGDARRDAERHRAKAVALDMVFAVQEAYFAVFAAKSIAATSAEAVARARLHKELAAAGVLSGMRPPVEQTRADAEFVRMTNALARAQGNVAIAQSTLAVVIGSDESAIDVRDLPSAPIDVPALSAAMKRAIDLDPRLAALSAELSAREAQTTAIGAALRPDLALTATLSGRAGGAPPSGNGSVADGNGWIPNVPNWDAGVVISWPLFDASVSARKSASRVEETVLREELTALRHEVAGAVRRAYIALDTARSAIGGLTSAVAAGRANYAQAEARFRAGLGTSLELADAEQVRTQAELELAIGQFEVSRTRAAFARVLAEEK